MANFTGKQKKLLAAGSAAAVLVLVLGIAVFTLGGGNAETPPAAPQGSQPDVAVSGIPQLWHMIRSVISILCRSDRRWVEYIR